MNSDLPSTLVVGRTNSGKTALLEALSLNFAARTHRSLSAMARRDIAPKPQSTIDLMVGLSLDDLRGIDQLFLPGPLPDSEFARKIGYERHDQTDSQKRFSDWYIAQPEHRFRFQLIRGPQEGWAHNNQVAVDYPCPADTQQISYRLTWQGTAPTLPFSPGARTPLSTSLARGSGSA